MSRHVHPPKHCVVTGIWFDNISLNPSFKTYSNNSKKTPLLGIHCRMLQTKRNNRKRKQTKYPVWYVSSLVYDGARTEQKERLMDPHELSGPEAQ